MPHSAADTPDPLNPKGPYLPIPFVPAFRSRMAHPPAPIGPQDREINDGIARVTARRAGDNLYQFRMGDFALTTTTRADR